MSKKTLVSMGVCALGLLAAEWLRDAGKEREAAAQTMPINCKTAPGDLRVLNSEKASTAAKIGNGISMVVPIGLVEGLVTGTEKTKYQVTTGEYNKALDTKISQIQAACPELKQTDGVSIDYYCKAQRSSSRLRRHSRGHSMRKV